MSDLISRQFEEIIVEHPEITDKEHKGKPYYSIKYVEDREKYIGYGTYKIEVLSSYIRDYFIPPAEPERKIYANMPDADFEKWLHDHGICNPNIHEAIPCSCVPLLIDSAINEIISVEPESDGNGSVSADTHEKMHDRTMGGLISRQEATTIPVMPVEYREYQTMNLDDAYEQGWFDLQKCIEELPYAEPERKTAEWIYGENGGQDGWYCSKCGLFIPWDYEYYGLDNIDFIADFHTCPKCDRKMLKYTGMRGEQE